MEKTKKELEKIVGIAKLTAIIDLFLAFVCAANGSLYFVWFMVLGGGMWAYASHIRSQADNIEGE